MLEDLSSKAVAAALVTVLAGSGATVVETRYVSAADLEKVFTYIQDAEVRRLELAISEVERRIVRVMLIPEDQRTEWDRQELIESTNHKESLLRELERLSGEDDG